MRKPISLIAAVAIAVLGFVAVAPPAGAVTYFQGHCKDADHLQEASPPAGATLLQGPAVNMQLQQATDLVQCVNDPAYRGPIYTFFINGNETLHMKPDGAQEVHDVFGYAVAYSSPVELLHTDHTKYIVFNDFSWLAAYKVVVQLENLGL